MSYLSNFTNVCLFMVVRIIYKVDFERGFERTSLPHTYSNVFLHRNILQNQITNSQMARYKQELHSILSPAIRTFVQVLSLNKLWLIAVHTVYHQRENVEMDNSKKYTIQEGI